MKQILFLFFLSVTSISQCLGQMNDFPFKAEFIFGIQQFNAENIGQVLINNDASLPEVGIALGLNLGYHFNVLDVGLEFSSAQGKKESTRMMNNSLLMYASKEVFDLPKFNINVQAGIGYQKVRLTRDIENPELDFQDFINQRGNQAVMNHGSGVADIGVGYKQKVGFPFLLKAGYKFGLNENDWELAFGNSLNNPKDRISGLYLNLIFNVIDFGNFK